MAVFSNCQNTKDALQNYQEAIEKRQHSGNVSKTDSMLTLFCHNAGVCLFHWETFKTAITKFEIAIHIRSEIDDQSAAISANMLGDCFSNCQNTTMYLRTLLWHLNYDVNHSLVRSMI